jgi:hypothetical protein
VFTYFVLADFGKAGVAWVERNVNDADRKTTVADISSGQWGDVMTILECNPAENICNDVTEELLREAGLWDEPLEPIDAICASSRRRDHECLRPAPRGGAPHDLLRDHHHPRPLAVEQGNHAARASELDV